MRYAGPRQVAHGSRTLRGPIVSPRTPAARFRPMNKYLPRRAEAFPNRAWERNRSGSVLINLARIRCTGACPPRQVPTAENTVLAPSLRRLPNNAPVRHRNRSALRSEPADSKKRRPTGPAKKSRKTAAASLPDSPRKPLEENSKRGGIPYERFSSSIRKEGGKSVTARQLRPGSPSLSGRFARGPLLGRGPENCDAIHWPIVSLTRLSSLSLSTGLSSTATGFFTARCRPGMPLTIITGTSLKSSSLLRLR